MILRSLLIVATPYVCPAIVRSVVLHVDSSANWISQAILYLCLLVGVSMCVYLGAHLFATAENGRAANDRRKQGYHGVQSDLVRRI